MFRRRNFGRLTLIVVVGFILRSIFISSTSSKDVIRGHNVLERVVSRSSSFLDVRRYSFLQTRFGRDEHDDLLSNVVENGADDYWERFQKPLSVKVNHLFDER